MQGFPAIRADRLKSDATRPAFIAPFHRADDVQLVDRAAALSATDRLVLCPEGNARLVDLDSLLVKPELAG